MDIAFEIPYTRILSRLGYRSTTSRIQSCRLNIIKNMIEEAAGFISLKGTYKIENFSPTEGGILLESGYEIRGTLPSKLSENAASALIMACTSGKLMTDTIASLQKSDMEKAVIYDATASEITDWGLEWIVRYVATMLKRENRIVSKKRFSPGYGDFELKNQRIFYRLLELDKLGISITESCILVPEKSVIAMTGIR